MPSKQTAESSLRGPAAHVSPHDNHTVSAFDCYGEQQASVDTVPNLEKARFRSTTLRRILRADLRIGADRVNYNVQGLGHRLPAARLTPPPVALGLGTLGSPLFVVTGEH